MKGAAIHARGSAAWQQRVEVLASHLFALHELAGGGVAFADSNVRFAGFEKFGQKGATRLVGGAFHRRRGNPDAKRLIMDVNDFIFPGARLHHDPEGYAVINLTNIEHGSDSLVANRGVIAVDVV